MIEVYTGSVGKIFLTTYSTDGLPSEPSSTPTVTITDAETGSVVTTGTASLIDSDYEGDYQYELPSSITSSDRVLKATWSYVKNGKNISEVEYIYVTTPYATVDEIISELGFSSRPEDPNYFPYEKIVSAERAARMMIDNELGFSMGKKAKTVSAYGSGADVLVVPERIISFDSITENDKLVIDVSEDYNDFGYNVEITETNYGIRVIPNTPGDDVSEEEYYDVLNLRSGQFKDGYRYDINGIFGWAYIPVEIKQCVFLLVNDLLCSDSIWRTKYVKKINSGQMSVEMSSLAFNATGNALVDAILQKFKMIQAVII